jgi:molecular chaperone DnaK
MIVGGYFHSLIEKNTTVPASRSHVFTTIKDNQTSVKIMVFQGEAEHAEENELLGEFVLTGLRRAPKGEVEVEVTFDINSDGIVSVSAKDLETGMLQSITVTATSGLTESEIRQMMEDNKDHLVDVRESEDISRDRQRLQRVIEEVMGLFPRVEKIIAGSEFGQDVLKKARNVLDQAREAVGTGNRAYIAEMHESLGRTLNMFKGVVAKTQG